MMIVIIVQPSLSAPLIEISSPVIDAPFLLSDFSSEPRTSAFPSIGACLATEDDRRVAKKIRERRRREGGFSTQSPQAVH